MHGTIDKIKRGDTVFVLEEKKFVDKIRTSNGNIGYLPKTKLADPEIIRKDMHIQETPIELLEGYSDYTKTYENIELSSDKTYGILLDDFILTQDLPITSQIVAETANYQAYQTWAETNEIYLIGTLQNELSLSAHYATYEQRNRIINDIYNQVMKKYYQGICLDFEQIDDVNSFYRFLIELTPKFKESGLKVLVKLNPQMDAPKVKNIVDFTIE